MSNRTYLQLLRHAVCVCIRTFACWMLCQIQYICNSKFYTRMVYRIQSPVFWRIEFHKSRGLFLKTNNIPEHQAPVSMRSNAIYLQHSSINMLLLHTVSKFENKKSSYVARFILNSCAAHYLEPKSLQFTAQDVLV